MNSIWILLLFSLQLNFVYTYSEASFRIVQGSPIPINEANYMVLVECSNRLCGGSLISMRHVVTSAQCVANVTAGEIIITAGITCLNEEHQRGIGQRVFFPHRWSTHQLDIAVVKVRAPFIPGPLVGEISLCSSSPQPGDMLHVKGWGRTQEKVNVASNILRSGTVRVVDNERCAEMYRNTTIIITETKMCAGLGGTGPCHGDSGGPGVNDNGELCAVISESVGCGRPQYPCVFVNILHNSVQEFLNSVAATEDFCVPCCTTT